MNDPEPSSELGRLRSAHQENIKQVVVHIVQPGDASGSSRFHPKALGRVSAFQGVDLYLHVQGLDTGTPAGRAMFQMLGVFSEFERAMIVERVKAGLGRARSQGKRLGRPMLSDAKQQRVRDLLAAGTGIVKTAHIVGCGVSVVQRLVLSAWFRCCTPGEAAIFKLKLPRSGDEIGGDDARRGREPPWLIASSAPASRFRETRRRGPRHLRNGESDRGRQR